INKICHCAAVLIIKLSPSVIFTSAYLFLSRNEFQLNPYILATSRFISSTRRCNKIVRLAFSDGKSNIKNELLPPSKRTFSNLTTLLENGAHHTGITLEEYLPWISFKTKRTRKRMRGPSAGPRFRKRAAEKGDAFLNLVKKRVLGGEEEERKVTATVR
ncbi:LOW QUALITY PROTEIN: hypothetical protein V1478_000301, partial [Vespula squamosa]